MLSHENPEKLSGESYSPSLVQKCGDLALLLTTCGALGAATYVPTEFLPNSLRIIATIGVGAMPIGLKFGKEKH